MQIRLQIKLIFYTSFVLEFHLNTSNAGLKLVLKSNCRWFLSKLQMFFFFLICSVSAFKWVKTILIGFFFFYLLHLSDQQYLQLKFK